MAQRYFLGTATPRAEITTLTVGATVGTGNTFTVTVNGKSYVYTAILGDDSTAVATALATGLGASEIAELRIAQSYVADAAVVTVTGPADGRKMVLSSSASGGSATLVTAITTTGTGPNYWSNTANWSGATLPIDADEVFFFNHDVGCWYDIDVNTIDLAKLVFDSTYTGTVGLPERNENGFVEFLDTRLKLTTVVLQIGAGAGAGSSRIRLNLQSSVTTTTTIYRTSQPATGEFAVSLIGTNASNTINIKSGSLGLGEKPTETFTCTTLKIGYQQSFASDVDVFIGLLGTATTVTMNGGTLTNNGTITTLTATGGLYNHESVVTMTTLTHTNTEVQWNTAGTLTTHVAREGAVMDWSRVVINRTVTNSTWYAKAALRDPAKTVTFTNAAALQCKLSELAELDLGQNIALNRT